MINAGPTREYIDPVRFLSNPSSGKMGFALAEEAVRRGGRVTLISGPVSLPTPAGVERIDVTTAEEMLQTCRRNFPRADIFIAAAAVGDYRADKVSQKLKKSNKALALSLKPTEDILSTLSKGMKTKQIVVGFAAETNDIIRHAKEKLLKKKLDLIVANDVSKKDRGFEADKNAVILIDKKGKVDRSTLLPKSEIAGKIWNKIEKMLNR